ncbi:MAG: outer membrane lipoprotein-sorting protein [Deltaproteobacteria bacterium]|nr:outer membrane lipoprotein-sorting protein [Deltaproteobacteria bacterium]
MHKLIQSLPTSAALLLALAAPAVTFAADAPAAAPAAAAKLDQAATDKLVAELDDRQRNSGDYKSRVYIRAKEKGKDAVVYEAVVYRRDKDDRFMILFLEPKSERGKGYLRIDRNLWIYDPSVGRWERRTERERIAGTDSRRGDFDESNLATEYTARYVEQGKLGKFSVHAIELVAKKGVDVAWPKVKLWLDVETHNLLKRQDYAASGRLMRTSYTPKWVQVQSPVKGKSVWVPKEMRIFDEVEKGNSTIVLIKATDLNALPANIFTKAWLESKSR